MSFMTSHVICTTRRLNIIKLRGRNRALIRLSARTPRTSRTTCTSTKCINHDFLIYSVRELPTTCVKMPKNILAEMGSQVGLTPRNHKVS